MFTVITPKAQRSLKPFPNQIRSIHVQLSDQVLGPRKNFLGVTFMPFIKVFLFTSHFILILNILQGS